MGWSHSTKDSGNLSQIFFWGLEKKNTNARVLLAGPTSYKWSFFTGPIHIPIHW